MRELLSILCAVTLITAVSALPVSADGDNRSMTVSTEIAPTFLVSVPADLNVPYSQEKTDLGTIRLDTAQLELHKCVKVSMISDNLLKNQADPSVTLAYTITEGTAETTTGKAFDSAVYLTAGEKTDLTVGITKAEWEKAYAGVYSNTVTFQIAYTDQSD